MENIQISGVEIIKNSELYRISYGTVRMISHIFRLVRVIRRILRHGFLNRKNGSSGVWKMRTKNATRMGRGYNGTIRCRTRPCSL